MTIDPTRLHQEAIVIDAVCPLARPTDDSVEMYREGGVTVIVPTVGSTQSATVTLRTIGAWHRRIASDPNLRGVTTADDIRDAKRDGATGILMHFQGTDPIEDDLDLVDAFGAAGVRIIQLCYNVRNRVGDGSEEPEDAGLSRFGRQLVRRLEENRIVVDCSHTGYRTSMDAIAASTAPVILSHSNPRGLHESRRNAPDDQLRAIAETGGVVGIAGFPAFLARRGQPSLGRFVDAISYVADLVGIEHVGLGIDYYYGQHGIAPLADARATYADMLRQGIWTPDAYPPPPHKYPAGIETPRTLPALTAELVARGFAEDDIRGVLGGNWVRVYDAVWAA
jgi:membrane dipeptidase